jgi:hypothetical protein
MTTSKLAKFLKEANKATYANKNAPKAKPSRLNSEDYHYEKGDLIYHDTYFGGRDFIGGEVVYEHKKPVWGENYFGFILNEEVDEREVYEFLRLALMSEYDDVIPVRGPALFAEGKNVYRFKVDGDLTNFSGVEEILFGGKVVYRCFVHGGMIK